MNDLSIIITMAGRGSRFREKGYLCPKYMIEVCGKTLFEWSIESLRGYMNYAKQWIFIVQKKDAAIDFIKEKCFSFSIYDYKIMELDHVTDGQATTCLYGIEECSEESSILIYNIDTYVEPFELKYDSITGDGFIPCFKAEGEHWSFIKKDNEGNVIEVSEKRRISDNCSLGVYYFSSARLYKKVYNSFYKNHRNDYKERYIAPLYNFMIDNNYVVTMELIDYRKVHVLGTPDELEAFKKGQNL